MTYGSVYEITNPLTTVAGQRFIDYFSGKTFGHLGFTGTSFWIDPEQQLIIVLLTNRVHPTREKPGIKQVRRRFHNTVVKSILNFN